MTHASVSEEMRKELGVTDTLVSQKMLPVPAGTGDASSLFVQIRLSVGIEDEEDIIADIDQALKAATSV